MGPRPPTEWERSLGMGWAVFMNLVADYRCIWTSDGIFDTAIFLKPPGYLARKAEGQEGPGVRR